MHRFLRSFPISFILMAICLSALLIGCFASPEVDPTAATPSGEAKAVSKEAMPARRVNSAVPMRTDPYWLRAQQEVYRSTQELQAQDERERHRGLVLHKLSRGNPKLKCLALTFDDGPHPIYTQLLLDILEQAEVKATFFVVGKMIEKHPELLRAIDDAGMEIGNHTFSHVTLTKIPEQEIQTEYRANNDIVKRVTGKSMRYCRPPGGDYDSQVIEAASATGLTTVLWTDDPGDYAHPSNNVVARRVLAKLSNGGIILLHDGIQETLDVLLQIISYAKKRGFRFVTISQLQQTLSSHP